MASWWIVSALTVALAACGCPQRGGSSSAPPVEPDAGTGPVPGPDSSSQLTLEGDAMSSSLVAGPALTPGAPLLAWLQSKGTEPRKRVRVPVVITFSNPGRFAIGTAWIGAAVGDPPEDAVHLKLDGTGLSVGLVEQIRGKCEQALSCVLWLDGLWGPRAPGMAAGMPGMPAAEGPTRHPFAVIEVGEPVDEGGVATVFGEP
jgi:hypothetical protein